MAISRDWAKLFAADWNARDLKGVLSHYTDHFEMSSPLIMKIAGEPSGWLRGKEKVAAYWRAALGRNPGLPFELLDVFSGPNSIVVHYRRNSGRRAAEVLFFDEQRLVYRAAAHYMEG